MLSGANYVSPAAQERLLPGLPKAHARGESGCARACPGPHGVALRGSQLQLNQRSPGRSLAASSSEIPSSEKWHRHLQFVVFPLKPRPGGGQPAVPAPTPPWVRRCRSPARAWLALQKMQEQTAQLHQKFLEGQETAQRTLQVARRTATTAAASLAGVRPPVAACPLLHSSLPPPVAALVARALNRSPVRKPQRQTRRCRGGKCVTRVLLEVIAEKTGYPVEMLELDMALDADLGIDSIKRVEILSALQERLPEAAPDRSSEHLGTLAKACGTSSGAPPGRGSTNGGFSPTHNRQRRKRGNGSLAGGDLGERRAIQWRCWNWTWPWMLTWASIRSSRVEILFCFAGTSAGSSSDQARTPGNLHSLRHIAAFLEGQSGNAPLLNNMVSGSGGAEVKGTVPEPMATPGISLQASLLRPSPPRGEHGSSSQKAPSPQTVRGRRSERQHRPPLELLHDRRTARRDAATSPRLSGRVIWLTQDDTRPGGNAGATAGRPRLSACAAPLMEALAPPRNVPPFWPALCCLHHGGIQTTYCCFMPCKGCGMRPWLANGRPGKEERHC